MFQALFSFFIFVLLLLPIECRSEDLDTHHHYNHHSDSFEFGFSLEYTYLDEESEEHDDGENHESHDGSESVMGLHAHVIRGLPGEGIQKYFGIGLGGEVLFTEDPHYGLMGSLAIYPWHEWVIMVSPGVEFAKHESSYESEFAMHYELSYGFEVGDYHIGPVVGFAHTQDAEHYSAGIHFGF